MQTLEDLSDDQNDLDEIESKLNKLRQTGTMPLPEVKSSISSYWSMLKPLKDTMKKATNAYNNNRIASTFKHHHHAPRRPLVPIASVPAPEPSSMDLDSIRLRKISAKEKQRHRNEGLCLYCGGKNHYASTCPAKNPSRVAFITCESEGNESA
ncbi:hypothetical protein BGX26_008031 [Mortierella sp. AD094]|nr:hypothetical protein BGX26_008031 [Mortierella sp. AD094]